MSSLRRGGVLLGLALLWLTGAVALSAPARDAAATVQAYYQSLRGGRWKQALTLLAGPGNADEAAGAMADLVRSETAFGPPFATSPPPPIARCESNLKNLGTALEMYSTDNNGRFPQRLAALTPLYLKAIPTCPDAGRDTYSASYQVAASPDAYTLYCRGNNHAREGMAPNSPQYTSTVGLISPRAPTAPGAAWTLASVQVLGQRVEAARARIDVAETYQVYGFPTRVRVRYPLVRRQGTWRIDAAALAPEGVPALAPGKEGLMVTWLKTHGLGVTLAALYAHPGAPAAP